jgi:hypothetical protein
MTWEPKKNLANAADVIADYWKRVASKKTRCNGWHTHI